MCKGLLAQNFCVKYQGEPLCGIFFKLPANIHFKAYPSQTLMEHIG